MEFSSGQRGERESSCGFGKVRKGGKKVNIQSEGEETQPSITVNSAHGHLHWERVGQISEDRAED